MFLYLREVGSSGVEENQDALAHATTLKYAPPLSLLSHPHSTPITAHPHSHIPPRLTFLPSQHTVTTGSLHTNTMSRSTDPGHFFQTDASESTRARRAAKSGNKNGSPIILQSKILKAIPDPFSTSCIYVAESAGCVRKVNIEVGMEFPP